MNMPTIAASVDTWSFIHFFVEAPSSLSCTTTQYTRVGDAVAVAIKCVQILDEMWRKCQCLMQSFNSAVTMIYDTVVYKGTCDAKIHPMNFS